MSGVDIGGDQSEVFGTEEINVVEHDDVGGAKTKRWRCEGRDDFGEAKARQHRASDTGRAILASRAEYQNRTLESHGVGILNTGTGPINTLPVSLIPILEKPQFSLIPGATKRGLR
jgi:hypothetical protein